jgi:hypothetical protein
MNPIVEYRVWMLFHHSDQAIWFPVSQLFSEEYLALRWAKDLNTDEYKIEAEEVDWS